MCGSAWYKVASSVPLGFFSASTTVASTANVPRGMPLCNESIGANVTAEEAGGATAIGSAAGEWPGGNLPKLPEESWFRAEAVRVRTAPPPWLPAPALKRRTVMGNGLPNFGSGNDDSAASLMYTDGDASMASSSRRYTSSLTTKPASYSFSRCGSGVSAGSRSSSTLRSSKSSARTSWPSSTAIARTTRRFSPAARCGNPSIVNSTWIRGIASRSGEPMPICESDVNILVSANTDGRLPDVQRQQ
jgi:hypothetical protein